MRFIDKADDLDAGAKSPRAQREDDPLAPPRAAEKLDLDRAEIRRLVMSIPNDGAFVSRDEWRNMLAAINHEFDGDEEGLLLALDWTNTWEGGDPNPDYTEATYNSLGGHYGRKKTGKWIVMLAAEHGHSPKAREVEPEEVFENYESEAPNEAEDDLLGPRTNSFDPVERLNKRHAVILFGDKVRILTEHNTGLMNFLTEHDFHVIYKNNRTQISPKVSIPISETWMTDPRRRMFLGGLVFRPDGIKPKNTLNLFRGFTHHADGPGSCEPFLEHAFENLALRNDEDFTYLTSWAADLLQHPASKPGVALAFLGLLGAGKTIFGKHLGALMHRHHVVVSDPKQLFSQYNVMFERALLVQLEEAYWAGDKRNESIIKSLITSEQLTIERKNVDTYQIDNFSRIMVTSNNRWVVPATIGERRFAVYEVGAGRLQDRQYFGMMEHELKTGGYAKLMRHLLDYKISIDVGVAPKTIGLTNQKIATLRGFPAWWLDVLREGTLSGGDVYRDMNTDWSAKIAVATSSLIETGNHWIKQRPNYGHGGILTDQEFGEQLANWCPSRQKAHRGYPRFKVYVLPSLAQCRAEFEARLGGKVEWDDDLVG